MCDNGESKSSLAPPATVRPVLSVAPMMKVTDHHFRTLFRLISRHTLLYTEMYPADQILAVITLITLITHLET